MFYRAVVRGTLAAVLLSAVSVRADVLHMPEGLTSLETVWVGDPGNAADLRVMDDGTSGYGAVAYSYKMGKYEVTTAQYCEFLNAKGKSDPYGLYNQHMDYALYPSYYGCNIKRSGASGNYTYTVGDGSPTDVANWANRPVNYVSWYDGIRFVNWLQNGQGGGDTESGTYTITGSGPNWTVAGDSRQWTPAAGHWLLPSEDEWYKAAYYDPQKPGGAGYWDYPTRSNTTPSNVGSDGYTDPGSHANFQFLNGSYTLGGPYWRTKVGEFENSASAYGTFDQGGNVDEWNEALVGSMRGFRGGSFDYNSGYLLASSRYHNSATIESYRLGFRVVWVPEPAGITMLVGIAATMLLCWWRKYV